MDKDFPSRARPTPCTAVIDILFTGIGCGAVQFSSSIEFIPPKDRAPAAHHKTQKQSAGVLVEKI
jgi:hypothetical protein